MLFRSFFAYKFLAQLGPEDIATNDKESWITKRNDGSIQALFWNYTPIAPPGNETDQTFYKKEQPAKPAPPAVLRITGIKDGRYALNVFRTGYRQNDAYTAYLGMGAPNQLTRAQVVTLQGAASGAPLETRTVNVKQGSFEQHFEMHENDTVLVTLTPK